MVSKTEREFLEAEAIDLMTEAYRLLGDAADCIRGINRATALEEIGHAKDSINNAKNLLS